MPGMGRLWKEEKVLLLLVMRWIEPPKEQQTGWIELMME